MPLHIEALPMWIAQTNAWLVATDGPGGECVLIDAPPDPEAILGRLRELELRLVALLNTHGHIDHVGGVGAVVRGVVHDHGGTVPVHIHDDDKHMLLDPAGTSGGLAQYPEGIDVRPPALIESLDAREGVPGAAMTLRRRPTPRY